MNTRAQSTLEFTFAMIVIVFLIYGMVRLFRWTGMDLAQRRYLQESSLTKNPDASTGGDPISQLNADIDVAQPMAAVWHGSITTNGN